MPIELMLATLTDRRDFGDDWLLERKFDGERCVAHRDGDAVRLESRTGKDLTSTYPDVARGAGGTAARPVPAGRRGRRLRWRPDLVQPPPTAAWGNPPFAAHWSRRSPSSTASSTSWRQAGTISPHSRWSSGVPGSNRTSRPAANLQISEAWRADSERRFAKACGCGWEGLIAKRADAPYAPGRSRDWLKLKCVLEQEFVIGGYTEPAGSRTDFGALLVGYYDGWPAQVRRKGRHRLQRRALVELGATLRELETDDSPFADDRSIPRRAHWVRPKLVAQIGFAEWTTEGRLRHARFLGMRDDKPPAKVVREQATSS